MRFSVSLGFIDTYELMEPNARLYHCLRCRELVWICSKCDRGHIYCVCCAPLARRESLQAAGQRYQQTSRGRRHHAARQQRYLQRQDTKMTHQGCAQGLTLATVNTMQTTQLALRMKTTFKDRCCHFCKKPCTTFVRYGFLRTSLRRRQRMLTFFNSS